MRSSFAVVVKAGNNLSAFPEICMSLCAWPAPLPFEIHEAVSELLLMQKKNCVSTACHTCGTSSRKLRDSVRSPLPLTRLVLNNHSLNARTKNE